MKSFLKGIVGLLLIVIAIGAIFYWEIYGREILLYEEIVILTQDVKSNDVITEGMVKYKKIEGTTVIADAIKDKHLIIGKAAKQYIPSGVQLVEGYFGNSLLILDDEQFIFKIPLEWLKAFPNSLRRGDVVYFYEVSKAELSQYETESEIIEVKQESKKEESIAFATVAYVKDSANREVVTLSDEARYDGSSKINEIEIIINLDMINVLRDKIDEGYQFIILYQ